MPIHTQNLPMICPWCEINNNKISADHDHAFDQDAILICANCIQPIKFVNQQPTRFTPADMAQLQMTAPDDYTEVQKYINALRRAKADLANNQMKD